MATASEPDHTSLQPEDGFRVLAEFDPPRAKFALKGELDLAAAGSLEREIESLAWPELSELVFDLAGLTFIDSTGLSMLLMAARRAASAGVGFSVIDVPDQAQRLFTLTGMTDRLNVRS